MSNAPLFEDARFLERIAKDPEIQAMVAHARRVKFAAGLALLVVLGAILLMAYFR